MSYQEIIANLMWERYKDYPPILYIPSVAEILKEKKATIYSRIRDEKFPVTVRFDGYDRQYVLLVDLVLHFCDGKTQPQPFLRPICKPRNPLGLSSKRQRGRPTKTQKMCQEGAGL